MLDIAILGIPMDLGAGRRGVDMGPSALRLARLEPLLRGLGHQVTDLGNVTPPVPEAIAADSETAYIDPIAASCREVYQKLRTLSPDTFPIALGGDHSVSMGTVSGVAGAGRTGVVWIDAHADLNTPKTSPSGNVHGMPLAHLLGYGDDRLTGIWGGGAAVRPRDIVLIGIRSLDDGERDLILEHGIKVYTMKEIDKRGMARVAEETLEHLRHVERLHLSFDADVLDPNLAPGVGTPVPGGLSYREAHLLMEMFSDADVVTSLDLIEVNPILDVKNSTAQIMVEMAASLLGKAIL
ncbi:MAG: arginase [Trueperaceae bacterium]|nr:arginase [Trueperaceae bacterium]